MSIKSPHNFGGDIPAQVSGACLPSKWSVMEELRSTFPAVLEEDWQISLWDYPPGGHITWWGGPARAEVGRALAAVWPDVRLADLNLSRFPRLSESRAVAARIEQAWGVPIPLDDLYEADDLGGFPIKWWSLPVQHRGFGEVFMDLCEGVLEVVPAPPLREELQSWLLHDSQEVRDAGLLLTARAADAPLHE